MNENYTELLDTNLYEVIIDCQLQHRKAGISEIIVRYENGVKERIWTYNSKRYAFNYLDFIGMTKLEAIFFCDRMRPNVL